MRRAPLLVLLFLLPIVPLAFQARAADAADLSATGPYAVGYTDVSFPAAGRTIGARVYYPATAAGANTAVATAGRPFPAISFGHGYLQSISRYTSTLNHLASQGFIVIAPTSEGGLFPSHSRFADDLRAALTFLETENSRSGSRFQGAVNTAAFGVAGHSMGGGASVLAASRDPRIKAVANLAAAETNPSAVTAAPAIKVPVQLIAGDRDTIAPPANHQVRIYNATNPPKQLRTIQGGFHCGFIDSGTWPCDSGSISRAQQLALTRRLLTEWFSLYLKGDTSLDAAVWGTPATADSAITFQGVR